MGRLTFAADIDTSNFDKRILQLENSIKRIAQQSASSGSILDKSFQKAGQSANLLGNDIGGLQRNLLGLASVATLGRLGQQIISIRGEFQQLGIAFEVMLGSKEKADKLMAEQIAFAQKTPFTLTDVATNTKQLLAMGIAQEKVMATMKSLGDVAAGVSVPLSRVAINYGQVATMGKLQQREIRDFAMAGIPIIDELAKNLGKAKSEIMDMVSAGQIGFPEVEKAFQTMSGEGGKFYNLMEKQNKSVTGQVSNLTDKIQVMMNEIGKSNEGLIYGGIAGLTNLVANYQEVLKVLGALVATYGIYRTALMLTTAAEKVALISTMAQEWLVMGRALGFATANQVLLNSAMLANPVVAAVAGITALVAIMLIFSEKAKTTEDHIKDLNDSMAQIGKQIEIEGAVQKFEELDKKVSKTKEEQNELNNAVQKLALIYPAAVTETDKYGKAVGLSAEELNKLNKEIRDNLILTSEKGSKDAQKELNTLLEKRIQLQNDINSGQRVTTVNNPRAGGAYNITTIFTSEEIEKKKLELSSFSGDIIKFSNIVNEQNKNILKLQTVDAQKILEPYRHLFADVATFSKQAAIDTKSSLQKIATPDGSIASDLVKGQISALDEYINKFKTTAQQEKEWKTQLTAAQAKLNEIKKAGYESLDIAKEKADQEEIIKSLKEKLGIKKNEKKAVDELKQAQEDLEKAVKKGDQAAINSQAAKVALLQKEYDLRKWIADEALAFAKGEVTQAERNALKSPAPITPISLKPIVAVGQTKMLNGVQYELAEIDKKGNAIWKKRKAEIGDLAKFSKDKYAEAKKDQEDLDKDKKKRQEEMTQQALQFMDNMLAKYGQQLGMTEDEAGLIASLAKGDYFAAAINMISVVSKFFKAEKDGVTEYYTNLDAQTQKLIENLDLVNRSLSNIGTGGSSRSFNVLSSELIKLKNDAARLNEQLVITGTGDGRPRGTTGQGTGTNGTRNDEISRARTIFDLSKQTAELYAEIEKLTYKLLDPNLTEEQRTSIIALLNSYNSIIDTINSSVQNITGTTIQDLSNSLIDAFLSGEDAAAQWGDTVDGIIKNVIKKQLVSQLLTAPITESINTLINDSVNGLTPDEASRFTNSMDVLYSTTKPIIDLVNGSFKASGIDLIDITSKSSKPLTGISASASEETVSAMVGQMMAARVDIKAIQETSLNTLELMDQSLSVLNNIDRNTRNNAVLPEIRDELKSLNQNIKNL